MSKLEKEIRTILQEEQCTFGEGIKRIEDIMKEHSYKVFCKAECGFDEYPYCWEKDFPPCEKFCQFKQAMEE